LICAVSSMSFTVKGNRGLKMVFLDRNSKTHQETPPKMGPLNRVWVKDFISLSVAFYTLHGKGVSSARLFRQAESHAKAWPKTRPWDSSPHHPRQREPVGSQ